MKQLDMFEELFPNRKRITKPIRLIELFAGYGSQHFALEYLDANYESYKISEWAVKSIQAYKDAHFQNDNKNYAEDLTEQEIIDYLFSKGISADYNEPMTLQKIKRMKPRERERVYNNIIATHNLVSVCNIKAEDLEIKDTNKYEYLMTYSFPCQDLSKAGKGLGMADTNTRSGLLWEVERILTELNDNKMEMPQILLMENVPDVIGEKNYVHFNKWYNRLKELGYKNFYKCLNAKNFGVPQNRDRCFMVSILGDYHYEFPKPFELKLRLRDILESNFEEKYYLKGKQLDYILDMRDVALSSGRNINNATINPKIAKTISCRGAADQRADVTNFVIDNCDEEIKVKDLKESDDIKRLYGLYDQATRWGVYDKEHISPTLTASMGSGGGFVPIIEEADQYIGMYQYANSDKFMKGKDRFTKDKEIADTLQTTQKEGVVLKNSTLRIRKLTPKECFRLMGVKDKDFENIAKNQSNSSLYHLAGDSIVVNVLMHILAELL